MQRREAIRRITVGMAGVAITGCDPEALLTPNGPGRDGRLSARPRPPGQVNTPGALALGLDEDRDAYLYVPAGLPP
jgi:hypothetical protein